MQAWTIVGYTFNADNYCPSCIIDALPTGDGEKYDGWAGTLVTYEEALEEIAIAFGIDREDEASFDSGDFPKAIFASDVEDDEYCGECHSPL